MPLHFIITYHRCGALDTSLPSASSSYTGITLPDFFSTPTINLTMSPYSSSTDSLLLR